MEQVKNQIPVDPIQESQLIQFIDRLTHLNDLDKYWARNDAHERLARGEKYNELLKRYEFYDKAGSIRESICDLATDGNGGKICQVINHEILENKNLSGKHDTKLAELTKIKVEIESSLENPIQKSYVSKVTKEVLAILGHDKRVEQVEFYNRVFSKKFWETSQKMFPAFSSKFAHFTEAFKFSTPDELQNKRSLTDLKKFPETLKDGLLRDIREMLAEDVFDKNERTELIKSIENLIPEDIALALEQAKFIQELRKRKLTEKETKSKESSKKKNEVEKKKEEEKKLQEKSKQSIQTKKETDSETKKKENKEKEKTTAPKIEKSAEKLKKIEFLNLCIEHAEKIKEKCPEMGIKEQDNPDFWNYGLRDRTSWLRKNGKWDDYIRFNKSDPHMPKTAHPDGFRYRWVNVETGPNLNYSKAESGIKFLKQLKESGYNITSLAAAFSINWRGSDSPTYDPKEFISKVQAEKNRIMSEL